MKLLNEMYKFVFEAILVMKYLIKNAEREGMLAQPTCSPWKKAQLSP